MSLPDKLRHRAAMLRQSNLTQASWMDGPTPDLLEAAAREIAAYVSGAKKLHDANTALMNECLHYRALLSDIAKGDGVYGAQAHEYKQIARRALAYKPGDPHPHSPREAASDA